MTWTRGGVEGESEENEEIEENGRESGDSGQEEWEEESEENEEMKKNGGVRKPQEEGGGGVLNIVSQPVCSMCVEYGMCALLFSMCTKSIMGSRFQHMFCMGAVLYILVRSIVRTGLRISAIQYDRHIIPPRKYYLSLFN
jgi:hypothetical protein